MMTAVSIYYQGGETSNLLILQLQIQRIAPDQLTRIKVLYN